MEDPALRIPRVLRLVLPDLGLAATSAMSDMNDEVRPYYEPSIAHQQKRAADQWRASCAADDALRQQINAELSDGRLPSMRGVSKSHRGTGRPCLVCRRAVEPNEVEREVTGRSGVVLTAHEACYKPWREESRAWRDLVAVGQSADRSGRTNGDRT